MRGFPMLEVMWIMTTIPIKKEMMATIPMEDTPNLSISRKI
jgi:hypothetical protein